MTLGQILFLHVPVPFIFFLIAFHLFIFNILYLHLYAHYFSLFYSCFIILLFGTVVQLSLWLISPLCVVDAHLLRSGWLLARHQSQNMGWVIYCCWHPVTAGTGSSSSPYDWGTGTEPCYRRQRPRERAEAQLLCHNHSRKETSAHISRRMCRFMFSKLVNISHLCS